MPFYEPELPYDRSLAFTQPFNLPVNALVVFLPEGNVSLSGENLEEAGFQDLQGQAYQMYISGGLPAGGELTFELSGRVSGPAPRLLNFEVNNSLFIGLGAFVLTLVGVGLWFRSKQQEASIEAGGWGEGEEDSAEAIMDAIIELDENHEAGEIGEATYQRKREELKQRLRDVL